MFAPTFRSSETIVEMSPSPRAAPRPCMSSWIAAPCSHSRLSLRYRIPPGTWRTIREPALDQQVTAAIAAAELGRDAQVLQRQAAYRLQRDRTHDPAPVPPVLRQRARPLDVVDAHDQEVPLARLQRRRRQA